MATITVTEKTFNKTIEKGVTLVDFWATWCPLVKCNHLY